jgi:hypothetical protein
LTISDSTKIAEGAFEGTHLSVPRYRK